MPWLCSVCDGMPKLSSAKVVLCKWWNATFCALQVVECHILCSASGGMPQLCSAGGGKPHFVLCKWWNATFCALQVMECHILCSASGGMPHFVLCKWWNATFGSVSGGMPQSCSASGGMKHLCIPRDGMPQSCSRSGEYSPDLEDPAIASQVQYPFADTTLIARFWRSLPALKWVHTQRNGVDLVIDSLKKNEAPPFILTKTPGDLNSSFIIEYVLGYIIAMNRKIFEARESQSRKDWQQRPLLCNQNIAECTVGILGVGENTIALAKACKVLGLHVWGMTRTEHVANNKCESIDVYSSKFSTCLSSSSKFNMCLSSSSKFNMCLSSSSKFNMCLSPSSKFNMCLSSS
ncbi:hypothetical protein MAR_008414 [Mya arenaria]|uniref:D-isomer specific 2-hydroxyacid dehydrogenase NAD-binding domain-containing protein n=1 Tax=Mya arenaria TaxID=6604 RepID=A0ABY7E3Y4_MYAAR|nr:hypothetical protein MAR_008414 [Mya arenaria]